MTASKLPALQIMKAAPQHAESLGSSGLAMILAICAQWDNLGCATAVCWSNSRMAERTGLSRNSVDKVRTRLIDQGWLIYCQDGRKAGHYTPKLPEWYAQSSAVECANGAQLTVQTVCNDCADSCATTVQMRVTYIPIPIPSPEPSPAQGIPPQPGEDLLPDSAPPNAPPQPATPTEWGPMEIRTLVGYDYGLPKDPADRAGAVREWEKMVGTYGQQHVVDAVAAYRACMGADDPALGVVWPDKLKGACDGLENIKRAGPSADEWHLLPQDIKERIEA